MTQPEWMQLKSIVLHDETDASQPWPDDASREYVDARRSLQAAEQALRDHVEEVARMRRALPQGPVVPDYTLTEGPADLGRSGRVDARQHLSRRHAGRAGGMT